MAEEKLDKILEVLMELRAQVAKLDENSFAVVKGSSADVPIKKKESIIEFYLGYKPKTDTDNALILLSYLDSRKHLENISSKDILRLFAEVRLPSPKNISDKMQLLHKRGLVIRSPNRPFFWRVSLTGDRYLEDLKNGS